MTYVPPTYTPLWKSETTNTTPEADPFKLSIMHVPFYPADPFRWPGQTMQEHQPLTQKEIESLVEHFNKLNKAPEVTKATKPQPAKTEAVRHDDNKIRWDLLPYESMEEIAKVMTWGATKYGEENWRSGLSFGRCFAATMRHLTAWWGGQTLDPESGINHLAHAATNIMFMISYSVRNLPVDDRPRLKS